MREFTEAQLIRAAGAVYLATEKEVADEISAMLKFAAHLVRKEKLMKVNSTHNEDWTSEEK